MYVRICGLMRKRKAGHGAGSIAHIGWVAFVVTHAKPPGSTGGWAPCGYLKTAGFAV